MVIHRTGIVLIKQNKKGENMKRKFITTIGEIQQGEYGLFGRINGHPVSLKEITDKDGKQKWLVNQTLNVYEIEDKNQNLDQNFQG